MSSIKRLLFFGELPSTVFHGISIANEINLAILKSSFTIDIIEEKNLFEEHGKIFVSKVIGIFRYTAAIISKACYRHYNYFYLVFSLSTFGSLKTLFAIMSFRLFNRGNVVLHIHRGDFFTNFYKSKLNKIITKLIFHACHKLIVLSDSQKEEIESKFHKKCYVLSNTIGYEPVFEERERGNSNFIFISNYIVSKGILDLLEVFSDLTKLYPNIKLQTYGTFLDKKLKKKLSSFNSQNISINGSISGIEKFQQIYQSDCLILPSWNEGQPIVLLEAMFVGTPVISTNVGLVPDLVGKYYPYLSVPKNKKSLKLNIINFINSHDSKIISQQLKARYDKYFNHNKHVEAIQYIFDNKLRIILDNAIFSLQTAGGISVVWSELVSRFLKEKLDDIRFIEYSNANRNIFRNRLPIKKESILLKKSFFYNIRRYLNPVCLGNEKFIFHSSYYRTSKSKNALNITTIHDFTYEYFVKGIPRYTHHIQKANAINNSHGIICVSENTKKDLLHFFPKTDLKKIRVIYNGVSDKYKPLIKENDLTGKFGILNNKRYLLFLGSRAKYKNFKTAIEVIQLLQEFELVIIGGGKLTKQENVHLNTLIPDKFLYYSELNEEELNLLYNYAFCLLYPSSHEGFGIPILEAMCAGCPVVTTNKSSIPEVAGDAALFVDVIKAENFVKKVLLLTNKKQREIIISKGFEQSQKFSWDKCYQETRQVYKEVYEADINK